MHKPFSSTSRLIGIDPENDAGEIDDDTPPDTGDCKIRSAQESEDISINLEPFKSGVSSEVIEADMTDSKEASQPESVVDDLEPNEKPHFKGFRRGRSKRK